MSDELELIPYSMRRRRAELDARLPQDRSADEDLNAVVDEAIRRDRRDVAVVIGFASRKGHRT